MRRLSVQIYMIVGLCASVGCNQPAEDAYDYVLHEMLEKKDVCHVDTGFAAFGDFALLFKDYEKPLIIDVVSHYAEFKKALWEQGVSLEFVEDPSLPSDCHMTEPTRMFHAGSSSVLSGLMNFYLPGPSGYRSSSERRLKVDVIRIVTSADSATLVLEKNMRNLNDPLQVTIETDPATGAQKRVFTFYTNPGSRVALGMDSFIRLFTVSSP